MMEVQKKDDLPVAENLNFGANLSDGDTLLFTRQGMKKINQPQLTLFIHTTISVTIPKSTSMDVTL